MAEGHKRCWLGYSLFGIKSRVSELRVKKACFAIKKRMVFFIVISTPNTL
jgi:hypothetical protein